MMITLSPLVPVPATSMSKVISALAAMLLSEMTAGVAAVELFFSLASMDSLVLKTVVPPSLMSTVGRPDELTVFTHA